MILALLDETVAAGARFEVACETIGLAARTVQRWKDEPHGDDGRAGPKTMPRHALTAEERDMIIALATSQKYRNLSVRQIVPLVADEGLYVASESSFYRVLHEEDLMAHRSAARPARHAKPKALVATGPRQVWSWDITYLRSATRGDFYYLYLVLDIWSRKIVGWEVHQKECGDLAGCVVESACAREGVQRGKLTLHSDNGGPMKGATMLATLRRLGIAASVVDQRNARGFDESERSRSSALGGDDAGRSPAAVVAITEGRRTRRRHVAIVGGARRAQLVLPSFARFRAAALSFCRSSASRRR